jgi:hypothetical protein
MGMQGRFTGAGAQLVIANALALFGNRMTKGMPAGVTGHRQFVAPYFDFRLAALRAGHVIGKWLSHVNVRHIYSSYHKSIHGWG